jgi:hypothetical protein
MPYPKDALQVGVISRGSGGSVANSIAILYYHYSRPQACGQGGDPRIGKAPGRGPLGDPHGPGGVADRLATRQGQQQGIIPFSSAILGHCRPLSFHRATRALPGPAGSPPIVGPFASPLRLTPLLALSPRGGVRCARPAHWPGFRPPQLPAGQLTRSPGSLRPVQLRRIADRRSAAAVSGRAAAEGPAAGPDRSASASACKRVARSCRAAPVGFGRRLLAEQQGGEPGAVGRRQAEQRRGERVEGAGSPRFLVAGANRGANGFRSLHIRMRRNDLRRAARRFGTVRSEVQILSPRLQFARNKPLWEWHFRTRASLIPGRDGRPTRRTERAPRQALLRSQPNKSRSGSPVVIGRPPTWVSSGTPRAR